ncbi:MAG: cupredoxin domain-containing protein [Actinomycetota bacterium]
MKRLLILPLAVLAALAVAAAIGAATTTVQITKNGFTPGTITVTAGDTVTWHNSDTKTHQVVADNGSFASPVLSAGQTYSFTPTKSGSFTYRDAYATSHKGTLKVNAPPATLSLGASLQTVIYGSATQLNGQISNQLQNQPVTLSAQAYGKSVQSVQSTTTQSGGTFIFGVTPTISTTYTAHYTVSNSSPVTVNVAPRVGFGRSGNLFVAKVTSDLGYSGHFVILQKKNATGAWYSFKHVYLGDSNRATFKIVVPKGNYTLRLMLPQSQAGLGYVGSVSRLIVWSHR